MKKIAVFPGSFDPFTKGHHDIVLRGLPLFDEVIIAIGVNSTKNYLFPLDRRLNWIRQVFEGESKVSVTSYEGLTASFCKSAGAGFILRGIRSETDFSFEAPIAQMNRTLANQPETIFLTTRPEFSALSSTILRDIFRNGGDVSPFVPDGMNIHV